jgi:hypothetical protein
VAAVALVAVEQLVVLDRAVLVLVVVRIHNAYLKPLT